MLERDAGRSLERISDVLYPQRFLANDRKTIKAKNMTTKTALSLLSYNWDGVLLDAVGPRVDLRGTARGIRGGGGDPDGGKGRGGRKGEDPSLKPRWKSYR